MRNSLIPALILMMGSVISAPALVSQVHAGGPPTLFVSPASTPLAPPNSLITFNVSVSNMPTFGGWDILVAVGDTSVLTPVSLDLVETFGGTAVELSNCVNGVGLGCDTRDGAGVAHSAAASLSGNGPFDSGNVTLFRVTFNSTSTMGYTLLTLPSPVVSDPSGISIVVSANGAEYGDLARAPVAIFSWSPAIPHDGDTVAFNASQSHDPSGGTIASYHWIIDGYGQTSNIPTTTFIFASTGDHTVSLTVTNDLELKSLPSTQTVHVIQRPEFEISSSPSSLTIPDGHSSSTIITITSIGNFTGTVTLTVSVSPLGPTVSLSTSSLFLTPDGQSSTVLLVNVGHTVAAGNYFVKVSGSGGGLLFYTLVGTIVIGQGTYHRHR